MRLSFSVTLAIPNCKMTLVLNICKKHVFKGFAHLCKPFLDIFDELQSIFLPASTDKSFFHFMPFRLFLYVVFFVSSFRYDETKNDIFKKCYKASLRDLDIAAL